METKNTTFYKGFDKNMQCRGFQYEENFTYTHDGLVELCWDGFHACELPLDVLNYYPLRGGNQYHQVELGGVSKETATDSKRVGKTITVGGELSLFGLIQAHVEIVKNKTGNDSETNAATTGDSANAATTGDSANAATTGNWANAATTGRYANAATTGYSAQIRSSVQDPDAVAAVLGEGAARGVKGSWIVLTERDDYRNLKEVRAVQVDGETVKENQYYCLSGGELVEVND